ncbi:MAG: efflux RND transporter permease subunit, partial [Deltaproteobacteria bacterium]|nr:efflux RND transporter permease subunit [Deltaproteobacteria bacterium]
MRWLAAFSIRNTVLVHMLVLGLLLMGTYAYLNLPRQLMSELAFNWAFIRVDYAGVPADDLEQLIAIPIEEQVRNVDGVSSVTNRSKEGFTFFSVKFESLSDEEFEAAYQELKDAVAVVRLPEEAEDPFWLNFSSADFVPMVSLVLAGDMSKKMLFDTAQTLEDEIEAIEGISKVDLGGVQERQIWVEVDPDLLHANGLSIGIVVNALRAANVSIPGGLLTVGSSDYLLRTTNQFDAVAAISDVVLGARPGGGAITVGDVSSIEDLWEEAKVRARYENDPAVTLTVAKKPEGNSLALTEEIRALADRWNERLGDQGRIAITGDSSKQIASMLGDLQTNALFGMVLVVAVLWLVLGLRNALLTALGIPLAFLATFIFMWWSGASLDGNSLFGLVLVLG